MEKVVTVQDLTKKYFEKKVVDSISFSVVQGEIFGLLGPNGAGKTTTLECLEGIRHPDSGHMQIMGIDPVREPEKLRNRIGVQLQSGGLPATIKVREAMQLFSAYHKTEPRMDLLQRLGLEEKMEAEYHTLSTGQQRRLALALATAHEPALLFLDEPTAGLDVASRSELHRLMTEIKESGTTIILSTHDMAEAEEMADRVAIMLQGKIISIGTPRELTASGSGLTKISVRTLQNSAEATSFPAVAKRFNQDEYTILFSSDIGATVSAIIAHIEQKEDTLIDLRVERPTLEERFLELTKVGGTA